MLHADVQQISESLGIRVFDGQREPVAHGGCHSRIYALRSEIGDLVLRVCAGQQGFYTQYFPHLANPDDWMDQRWAIEKARSVGVPAPEMVYSNREKRWVVMRRLPGVPINSDYESWDRCPYDEAQFGEILHRLHSVQPSGYGPIDDYGRTLFSTWQDFLTYAAESALDTCVERASLPSSVAVQLERCWFPRLRDLALERPSLLHMESLGFANIMYIPETRTITGLLDYEDCIGGDPLFEICWMMYYFEDNSPDQSHFSFRRFAAGYGGIDFDSERLHLYSPFLYLDKLRWVEPDGSRAGEYVCRLEEFVRQV